MVNRKQEYPASLENAADWRVDTVALIGAGVVGRGWIPVFGRRVLNIRIYDQVPGQAEKVIACLDASAAAGNDHNISRIEACTTLAEALDGALYVQESIPEILDDKQELFRQLDSLADDDAILASSTSSLDINEIAAGLDGRNRCITAHPFNPPSVLPAVEVLPVTENDPIIVNRATAFLRSVGQVPIRLHRFVPGYVGNRLQLALMREAIALVEEGVADTEAVDALLSEAIALRWAVFGTFGTNHCNADDGIRAYYENYGAVMRGVMDDLSVRTASFNEDMSERYGTSVEERFRGISVSKLSAWRDRLIMKIRHTKDADDNPRD